MGKKDYEVGYGKPPKSGQFKPGQSGNPKGRPKGAKNFKTELATVLANMIYRLLPGEDPIEEIEDFTDADKAILERFEQKVLAKAEKKGKKNGK